MGPDGLTKWEAMSGSVEGRLVAAWQEGCLPIVNQGIASCLITQAELRLAVPSERQ
jgi:hypothetical protein